MNIKAWCVAIVVSFLGVGLIGGKVLAIDDASWQDQYAYIGQDTVWKKSDTLVFDKEVFVDNNATLTIEAGAQVHLNGGNLTVNYGNVVALGTEEDPIVMTSDNPDSFTVVFVDYEDGYDGVSGKTSSLQYVHIVGGGYYSDPDNCGTLGHKRSFFVETAFAGECAWGVSAIRYMSGRVEMNHMSFIGTHYADVSINAYFDDYNKTDFLKVSNSNFGDNSQSTALSLQSYCSDVVSLDECSQKIVMRNNWWGDASGPYYSDNSLFESSNIVGSGDKISGEGIVLFRSWSDASFEEKSTSNCTENCFSNVLFLPGIEASRLYAMDKNSDCLVNCENQLWEPNRNDDVKKLYLDKDGNNISGQDIYTRDILDETNIVGANIYKSFIENMNDMKSKSLIHDWKAIPYDWRLSLDDIVHKGTVDGDTISYGAATDNPYLVSELRALASSSKTGKVTIVAHSHGGLVAKELMQELGDTEVASLIDTVIFVAVPQIGTPAAIGAMLHGYDQDILGGLIVNKSTARGLAEYMPSAYALLPSKQYFKSVKTPVVSFDAAKLPEWSDRYSETIDSHQELQHFVNDTFGRVDAVDVDISKPDALHKNFADYADAKHESLDTWVAPGGVRVIQIAGWGVPATMSGMHYTTETKAWCERALCSHPIESFDSEPVFTIDGDGTVVTPSALDMNVERYWVDLNVYNQLSNRIETGRFLKTEHADILEASELENFIKGVIVHDEKSIDQYKYLKLEAPQYNKDRLQYSLHSPLSLDLYDNQGRHTGLDANGNIETHIPGTYYRQYGEKKYIFADTGAQYRIVMRGYAEGEFTFSIEQFRGDASVGKTVFKDLPTTNKTEANISINHDIDGVGNLIIDEDGDGKADYTLKPEKGNEVSLSGDSDVALTLYYDDKQSSDTRLVSDTKNEKKKKKHETQEKKKKSVSQKPTDNRVLIFSSIQNQSTPRQESQENQEDDAAGFVAGDSVSNDTVIESSYQENSSETLAIQIFHRVTEYFVSIWAWLKGWF